MGRRGSGKCKLARVENSLAKPHPNRTRKRRAIGVWLSQAR